MLHLVSHRGKSQSFSRLSNVPNCTETPERTTLCRHNTEPRRRPSQALSAGDPQRYRRCVPSRKTGIGSAVRKGLLWSTTRLSFTFSRSARSVVVN